MAERRPRRPPGPTGERPGQPVAAAGVRDPGSVRLVRVRGHERRRRCLGPDLPDCARWEKDTEIDTESPNSKFNCSAKFAKFSNKNAINPKNHLKTGTKQSFFPLWTCMWRVFTSIQQPHVKVLHFFLNLVQKTIQLLQNVDEMLNPAQLRMNHPNV